MNNSFSSWQKLSTLSILLISILIKSLSLANQVNAQTPTFNPVDPGTNTSGANRTRGTGTSGECEIAQGSERFIAALAPIKSKNTITINPLPVFWFYVPFSGNDIPMKFTLLNDKNEIIYPQPESNNNNQLLKRTSEKGGFVKFVLPVDLKIGKEYTWLFTVSCEQSQDSSEEFFVMGKITRINPSSELNTKLQQANTNSQKAKIYGEYGIWFEFLDLLANDYCANSDNPNEAWIMLWKNPAVKLEELANSQGSCSTLVID